MERTIRVLLVDDSNLARSMLRTYLETDGDTFCVVGEAADGAQAAEKAKILRPDLITMDLEMPVMDGFAAIDRIMSTKAVPILVVSSVADANNAYKAVSLGAVDVTGKPGMSETEIAVFLEKARQTARVPVITRICRPTPAPVATPFAAVKPAPISKIANGLAPQDRIIAIACSTGGPQALSHILSRLPADMKCPIVVAQHISDGFATGMASWLSSISAVPVRVGQDGALLEPGIVYLSPSETNMAISTGRRIVMTKPREDQIYHPSCDILLSSAAATYGHAGVGVILTGMGSDGVQGMQAIRGRGGLTLAQDERSSLIFGMNARSIENGVIQHVLPLDEMAAYLVALGGGTGIRSGTP